MVADICDNPKPGLTATDDLEKKTNAKLKYVRKLLVQMRLFTGYDAYDF